MKSTDEFNTILVKNCASAFSTTAQLGIQVSMADGELLASYGEYNCETCKICHLAGRERLPSIYGMNESKSLGGKFMYSCPVGLTCFTSPIVGAEGSVAKITAGPFLMTNYQDYICHDLLPILENSRNLTEIERELTSIPQVEPSRAEDMSSTLFTVVGFLSKVWAASNMLDIQQSYSMQKLIYSYSLSLKHEEAPPPYPFQLEDELMNCIVHNDRNGASYRLNEWMGYIVFSMSGNFQMVRSRVSELLVLMSRAAVKSGADENILLMMTHNFIQAIPYISQMDELCSWLAKAMNSFLDQSSEYTDAKHANAIHSATQYIRMHFAEKISLDEVAEKVYLSPSYFSRVFRRETGETFTAYLNKVRIEHSKKLLTDSSIRIIDISIMAGFDNQSYFSKVFKKSTGMTPLQYREKICRSKAQEKEYGYFF